MFSWTRFNLVQLFLLVALAGLMLAFFALARAGLGALPRPSPFMALSGDGTRLAQAATENVALWDTQTGQHLGTLVTHGRQIQSLAYSPDGKFVAGGGWDGSITLWSTDDGTRRYRLKGHTDLVQWVTFSPDGTALASGGRKRVQLWDAHCGKHLATLQAQGSQITCLAFAADGKTLAVSNFDGTVELWDVAARIRKATFDTLAWVTGIAFSPDGTTLVTAGSQDARIGLAPETGQVITIGKENVQLWDVPSGRRRAARIHAPYVECMAISRDGEHFATAGDDGTIKLWDLADGAMLHTFQGNVGNVRSLVFSPDGRNLVAATWGGRVYDWEVAIGGVRTRRLGGVSDRRWVLLIAAFSAWFAAWMSVTSSTWARAHVDGPARLPPARRWLVLPAVGLVGILLMLVMDPVLLFDESAFIFGRAGRPLLAIALGLLVSTAYALPALIFLRRRPTRCLEFYLAVTDQRAKAGWQRGAVLLGLALCLPLMTTIALAHALSLAATPAAFASLIPLGSLYWSQRALQQAARRRWAKALGLKSEILAI